MSKGPIDPSVFYEKVRGSISKLIGGSKEKQIKCEMTLNLLNDLESKLRDFTRNPVFPQFTGKICTNHTKSEAEVVSQTHESACRYIDFLSNVAQAKLDFARVTEEKRRANSLTKMEIVLNLISMLDFFLTWANNLIDSFPAGVILSTSVTEEMIFEKKARVERKFEEEVNIKKKHIRGDEKLDEEIAKLQKVVESLDYAHLGRDELLSFQENCARLRLKLELIKKDINQKTFVSLKISAFSFKRFGFGKIDKDGNPVDTSAYDSEDEGDDVEDSFGGGGKATSSSSEEEES
jgi:hypothetical protein